jgi:hypothetical protein
MSTVETVITPSVFMADGVFTTALRAFYLAFGHLRKELKQVKNHDLLTFQAIT